MLGGITTDTAFAVSVVVHAGNQLESFAFHPRYLWPARTARIVWRTATPPPSSPAPVLMRDATVPVPPKASRGLLSRWREWREAALLYSLVDYDEGPDHPRPRSLVPWVHPTLRGIAHPATWECGLPSVVVMYVGSAMRVGWHRFLPLHTETRIFFALWIPLVWWVATTVGRAVLARRYTDLAMQAYHRRLWQRAPADEQAPVRLPR